MSNNIKTAAEAIENAALAAAYGAQVDADGNVTATQPAVPETGKAIADKSSAEWAYERIVLYIQEFEKTLDNEQEVGMGFAGSDAGSVRIQGMGFFAPDIVTFYGTDNDGNKMQLVQHVSQLNVLLVAEPKAEEAKPPQRIGFKLAQDLQSPS